jgi:hypothetical protein
MPKEIRIVRAENGFVVEVEGRRREVGSNWETTYYEKYIAKDTAELQAMIGKLV